MLDGVEEGEGQQRLRCVYCLARIQSLSGVLESKLEIVERVYAFKIEGGAATRSSGVAAVVVCYC